MKNRLLNTAVRLMRLAFDGVTIVGSLFLALLTIGLVAVSIRHGFHFNLAAIVTAWGISLTSVWLIIGSLISAKDNLQAAPASDVDAPNSIGARLWKILTMQK